MSDLANKIYLFAYKDVLSNVLPDRDGFLRGEKKVLTYYSDDIKSCVNKLDVLEGYIKEKSLNIKIIYDRVQEKKTEYKAVYDKTILSIDEKKKNLEINQSEYDRVVENMMEYGVYPNEEKDNKFNYDRAGTLQNDNKNRYNYSVIFGAVSLEIVVLIMMWAFFRETMSVIAVVVRLLSQFVLLTSAVKCFDWYFGYKKFAFLIVAILGLFGWGVGIGTPFADYVMYDDISEDVGVRFEGFGEQTNDQNVMTIDSADKKYWLIEYSGALNIVMGSVAVVLWLLMIIYKNNVKVIDDSERALDAKGIDDVKNFEIDDAKVLFSWIKHRINVDKHKLLRYEKKVLKKMIEYYKYFEKMRVLMNEIIKEEEALTVEINVVKNKLVALYEKLIYDINEYRMIYDKELENKTRVKTFDWVDEVKINQYYDLNGKLN